MQILGFITILILTALAGMLVRDTASDPAFVEVLAGYSQWAANHAEALGWGAVGIVLLAGIAVPPALLRRDMGDGADRMGAIGDFVGAASLVYVVLFLALPGAGYLLGMGWFAARKAAGL